MNSEHAATYMCFIVIMLKEIGHCNIYSASLYEILEAEIIDSDSWFILSGLPGQGGYWGVELTAKGHRILQRNVLSVEGVVVTWVKVFRW